MKFLKKNIFGTFFNEFLFGFFFYFIFLNFKEKPDIFNIGIVSYSVNLQI